MKAALASVAAAALLTPLMTATAPIALADPGTPGTPGPAGTVEDVNPQEAAGAAQKGINDSVQDNQGSLGQGSSAFGSTSPQLYERPGGPVKDVKPADVHIGETTPGDYGNDRAYWIDFVNNNENV